MASLRAFPRSPLNIKLLVEPVDFHGRIQGLLFCMAPGTIHTEYVLIDGREFHGKFWARREDNGFGPHHQFHSKAQDVHTPHTGATSLNSGPRKVPPGAIRPLYYPSIRNLTKEAPARSLGRNTRLCGERQRKIGLEVSSLGRAVREASPGYALPRTAVSRVPQQRASSPAHADLDVTQLWVWSLPLLSMS